MTKNKEQHSTTFWYFLQNYLIEIPIIQRDYAQGRENVKDLRNEFVNSLINSLQTGKTQQLDFIYGDIFYDNKQVGIHPLDGQQRLTTLWLLHWFIALKAGCLKEAKTTLKRFTYSIRESSRIFIDFLLAFDQPCKSGQLRDTLTRQNLFYKVWEQDPTVVSMLNMINCIDQKLNNDIDFTYLWETITGTSCPIIFYTLPLKDIGHTDDLYIKMNARGKALSGYENFKADLIKLIRDRQWGKKIEYSTLLDGEWTDIFWNYRRPGTSHIDKIYLAFLTRYLINKFIVKGTNEDGKKYSAAKLEELPQWKLYLNDDNTKGDESYQLKYTSFKLYEPLIDEQTLQQLKSIFHSFKKIDPTIFNPLWNNDTLDFIPHYKEGKGGITLLTMKQRVVFHGICCYLRIPGVDEVKLKQWMRVVWNLAENTNYDSTSDSMVGAMRLIDELGEHSHDIYSWFKLNEKITSDTGRAQIKEEREKADKLLLRDGNIDDMWEQKIITAEKSFSGAIRFLFHNENGELDWKNFDAKWNQINKILTSEGVRPEYKQNALAIRTILSYCDQWQEQIESWSHHYHYIFSNSYNHWRNNILLRTSSSDHITPIYARPVHHLLMGDNINPSPSLKNSSWWHERAFRSLIDTDIISRYNGDRYYVRWYKENLCLYPSSEGVILTMQERDEILSTLIDNNEIQLTRGSFEDTSGRKMFWGWEIHFIYKEKKFNWSNDNRILPLIEGGYTDYDETLGLKFKWDAAWGADINKLKSELNKWLQRQSLLQLNTDT